MGTKRDEFEDWIRDYLNPRYPELVQPVLQAVDAFDRLNSADGSESDDLTTLVAAACSHRAAVGENAATLLGQLGRAMPQARLAIVQMSQTPQLHVRIHALIALDWIDVCDTHEAVARELLRDRSARVRNLVADKVREWRLRSLLPDLQVAIDAERSDSLRSTLELQRDLLRDGFRIEPTPSGRLSCTFQKPGGGLISTSVSEAEWRAQGLDGVARSLGIDPATLASGSGAAVH